ncbi:hypothetical protein [Bradyrhizobium sp. SZCCHNR1051]|uniref:hypothetical protein n=1 Tax=Bradyrhizobium sp. SZCCHNR1051 TaxID=3057355 RepID=UPI00291678E2|nr:hypothetical protein [Bradyrhizobium sp. SZCCHNR1051]
MSPVPNAIINLYRAGELAAELTKFHDVSDRDEQSFVGVCVHLHNDGLIDLVDIPSQPQFANIEGHDFFTVQQFYCDAIPDLRTNADALMECCRILIERGGADLAANQPNGAFRKWCARNPREGSAIIQRARAGDHLAKRFVTFAIQASEDVRAAIDFIIEFDDERRLFGMAALAGMGFTDTASAQQSIQTLETFISEAESDNVRANALHAASDILKRTKDSGTASRLVIAGSRCAGPSTLHCLAQVIWLQQDLLSEEALTAALNALETTSPEHLGTIRTLDLALSRLLTTQRGAIGLNFITAKLRDGQLTLEKFPTTKSELTRNDPNRLYELIIKWLRSGNAFLCDNADDLIPFEETNPFDANITLFNLKSAEQLFICRKAIGFLFLRPVTCCSIIVSILRGAEPDTEEKIVEMLFDPLLLNYSGSAIEYLKGISVDDPAYAAIQKALSKHDAYLSGLRATGTIEELHPSDYERDIVLRRSYDQMRDAQKAAEKQSVLLELAHRSTLLYGKRSLAYIQGENGESRATTLDLHSVGISYELPRRDIIDPVGLDYVIRVFRAERLQ